MDRIKIINCHIMFYYIYTVDYDCILLYFTKSSLVKALKKSYCSLIMLFAKVYLKYTDSCHKVVYCLCFMYFGNLSHQFRNLKAKNLQHLNQKPSLCSFHTWNMKNINFRSPLKFYQTLYFGLSVHQRTSNLFWPKQNANKSENLTGEIHVTLS